MVNFSPCAPTEARGEGGREGERGGRGQRGGGRGRGSHRRQLEKGTSVQQALRGDILPKEYFEAVFTNSHTRLKIASTAVIVL